MFQELYLLQLTTEGQLLTVKKFHGDFLLILILYKYCPVVLQVHMLILVLNRCENQTTLDIQKNRITFYTQVNQKPTIFSKLKLWLILLETCPRSTLRGTTRYIKRMIHLIDLSQQYVTRRRYFSHKLGGTQTVSHCSFNFYAQLILGIEIETAVLMDMGLVSEVSKSLSKQTPIHYRCNRQPSVRGMHGHRTNTAARSHRIQKCVTCSVISRKGC